MSLGSVSVATQAAARTSIGSIDNAISSLTGERGFLGALQNRLTFNVQVNSQAFENNQATESSLRDADIADEVSQFSRDQILSQSALALFAQANIISARAFTLIP